jgi:hypothetical protein
MSDLEPEYSREKKRRSRVYQCASTKYDYFVARCEAIYHYCRACREAYGGWEQEKKALEILAVVFIFIYTSIQGCQLWVIRDQERHQLRAYINTDGAWLKCPSCDTITSTLRQKTRADQQNIDILVKPNINDRFFVVIKNFGQTPADNILVHISFEVLPPFQQLPDNFTYADKLPPLIGNVIPGENAGWLGNGQQGPWTYYLTSDAIAGIIKARVGLATVYVYGHIDYEDIFGYKHRRPFVFLYNGATDGFGVHGRKAGRD